MRDPERPGAVYRKADSPATLNDLRWLYKKLLELEALVRSLQAEQMRLSGRVAEDRRYLSAIAESSNQIIRMLLPTAAERQKLRRLYTDLARPSRSRRRRRPHRCSDKPGILDREARESG